jgi:hypothetical protein
MEATSTLFATTIANISSVRFFFSSCNSIYKFDMITGMSRVYFFLSRPLGFFFRCATVYYKFDMITGMSRVYFFLCPLLSNRTSNVSAMYATNNGAYKCFLNHL